MAHFSLSLLGAYQATRDGEPVTRFGSVKTQALLAYLAVEADRPHRRDALAGLLWPEEPDRTARNNFRHALSMLRQAVGDRGGSRAEGESPPILLVTRETVQFDCTSDCWVDVHAFRALSHAGASDAGGHPVDSLAQAVALYRGDFLEGFYVSDSAVFDDWALMVRERLQRQASAALRWLIEAHTTHGRYPEACTYAWRWVELEPWQETAHQQLMTALALHGRRTEALAQFETCRRMLVAEYGVDPSPGTLRLWREIRDGTLAAPEPVTVMNSVEATVPSVPGFVGRERELASLEQHLASAMGDQGRVVLVAGEAGQGKTTLVQVFAERAQRRYPRLLVAGGNCNAYTGVGDPYLPFREIMELLTGDVEARAASLGHDHARRLQKALPLAARALTDHGPDLIGVFVPGEPLLRRALAYADGPDQEWVEALDEVVARQAIGQRPDVRQEDLFEQVTKVLAAVARHVPLVLIIDDLQWADLGTLGLLFHLGRRLAGSRILIVGAYRPEEVGAGREGARHPLEAVIHEFGRLWGDILVDLHEAESRRFVEALLDSDPNRLGDDFRETLYRQTGGHALFTVELLRGMQERGDLIKDEEGRWVVGPHLDWSILPARIEAVIGERVGRLTTPLRAALQGASVEGELFTAEVVARARDQAVEAVIEGLSSELDRKHHLVRAVGIQRVDGQRLSQYRFRHILFQTYLYNNLDEIERAHLHERVAVALEGLYRGADDTLAIVPQLARQFEQAGMVDKAVQYYELAGQRATRMLGYEEAVAHLTRGIELLEGLSPSAERDARELRLRLAVAAPIFVLKSWGADELVEHYSRAGVLAERLGDIPRQLQFLRLASGYQLVRAQHRQALVLAERYYALAERLEDPLYMMPAHEILGATDMFLGRFEQSTEHMAEALELYDSQMHSRFRFEYGQDSKVTVLVFGAYGLWYLGYPDQALQAAQEAVSVAEDLRHPLSMCLALAFQARVHRWRGEVEGVAALIPAQGRVAKEYAMPLSDVGVFQDQAWVTSQQGNPEAGIAMYNQALAFWDATGMANHLTEFYGVLAEMHGKAGRLEEGLQWIAKAMALMEKSNERYHEAELYRLRGELLRLKDPDEVEEAAADFHRAIEVAQRQHARSLELRAAMSLVRLWRDRGATQQLAAAREHLAEVYAWFTEGFDTRDLVEARELLGSGLA